MDSSSAYSHIKRKMIHNQERGKYIFKNIFAIMPKCWIGLELYVCLTLFKNYSSITDYKWLTTKRCRQHPDSKRYLSLLQDDSSSFKGS